VIVAAPLKPQSAETRWGLQPTSRRNQIEAPDLQEFNEERGQDICADGLGLSLWLILESFKFDYMTTYTPARFSSFLARVCLGLLSLFSSRALLEKGARETKKANARQKSHFKSGADLLFTRLCALHGRPRFVLTWPYLSSSSFF